MRSGARVGIVLSGLLVIASCQAFLSVEPIESVDAAAADSSTIAALEAGGDVAADVVDGGGSDAPSVDAVAIDASVSGCAAYADAGYAFCDDFEDASTLKDPNWRIQGTDTGLVTTKAVDRISIVDGGFSAPNALQATLPPFAEDSGSAAQVVGTRAFRTNLTAAKRVRVHARIKVVNSQREYVDLLNVEFPGPPYYVFSLFLFGASNLTVVGETPRFMDLQAGTHNLATWTEVELAVELGSVPYVELSLDGTKVADGGSTQTFDGGPSGNLNVGVGINVSTSVAYPLSHNDIGTTVLIDDLVVWTE